MKAIAGIASSIGGGLFLVLVNGTGTEWWQWLVAGVLLVGGTLIVRFVPDYL